LDLEFVSALLDAYFTLWLLLTFLIISHRSHIFWTWSSVHE
jgi:hypothetical protein